MTERGSGREWPRPNWPFESTDPLRLSAEYAQARRQGEAVPVRLYNGDSARLVTRHPLVAELLSHPQLSANPRQFGYPVPSEQSRQAKSSQRTLVRLDPPEHTEIRRALLPSLSRAVVSTVAEYANELAGALVDKALHQGLPEIVASVAFPFPLLVAARWLGIPHADAQQLAAPASAWAGLSENARSPAELLATVDDYFFDLLGRTNGRGWSPTTTNLLERLALQGADSVRRRAETLGHLFTSGLFTTSNTLALAFLALARFPEQRAALIASGEDGIPRAVDELLRFTCVPRHSALRTTTAEIQVGHQVLAPGTGVIASIAAANRDPAVFPNADELDLARSPNRHLTFGPGTHGCIGSPLARLEIAAIARALQAHPRTTHPWTAELVEHHFGTTLTVDRLVLRVG